MLSWLKRFNIFCFLDNCNYNIQPHRYECLVAVGAKLSFTATFENAFKKADDFIASCPGWCFGHLAYSINGNVKSVTNKQDLINFPACFLFEPEVLIIIQENILTIQAENPVQVYNSIQQQNILPFTKPINIHIKSRLTKQQYLDAIQKLLLHIKRGDCYEINFCQEFFSTPVKMDPFILFQKLIHISPNPFAAFYRLHDKYLISASPERFLKKDGNKILSQPMKGTAKRNLQNDIVDNHSKESLYNSAKERAENVMVVDLVRNDLSKICKEGSVKVDELYGIYSFPQVHQMVSTISGELIEDIKFSAIIDATFPMGSMTGAPKKSVMDLIDSYEVSQRGIFSGAVGYINKEKNFDFNVVIRSIMYNATNKYLSYQVGSGITAYSNAENEWEECLLKAEAIKKVLTA